MKPFKNAVIYRLTRDAIDLDNIQAKLESEVKLLKDENEYLRVRFKEADLICGKLIIAMRCAIIEAIHGGGDKAGLDWIYDALWGPGELPPDGEANAKEYSDRELAKIDAELTHCYDFYREKKGHRLMPINLLLQ